MRLIKSIKWQEAEMRKIFQAGVAVKTRVRQKLAVIHKEKTRVNKRVRNRSVLSNFEKLLKEARKLDLHNAKLAPGQSVMEKKTSAEGKMRQGRRKRAPGARKFHGGIKLDNVLSPQRTHRYGVETNGYIQALKKKTKREYPNGSDNPDWRSKSVGPWAC